MKKILIFVLFFSFWLSSLSFATEGSTSQDFLEQVFSPAIQQDTIVGGDSIGTTKRSVWKYVLKEGTTINIGGSDAGIHKRQSLIIQITKFLLWMTMVLAVTMIIYNGVMYVVKASKGENPKEILNNLIYIWVWILLALLSVVIIRLVSSIGTGSIGTI